MMPKYGYNKQNLNWTFAISQQTKYHHILATLTDETVVKLHDFFKNAVHSPEDPPPWYLNNNSSLGPNL